MVNGRQVAATWLFTMLNLLRSYAALCTTNLKSRGMYPFHSIRTRCKHKALMTAWFMVLLRIIVKKVTNNKPVMYRPIQHISTVYIYALRTNLWANRTPFKPLSVGKTMRVELERGHFVRFIKYDSPSNSHMHVMAVHRDSRFVSGLAGFLSHTEEMTLEDSGPSIWWNSLTYKIVPSEDPSYSLVCFKLILIWSHARP